MKILCTFISINISKLNFWFVIGIALKAIFAIFRFFLHPHITDFQIVVSRPNIVLSNKLYINRKLIYSAFGWCINRNFETMTLKTGLWSRVTFNCSENSCGGWTCLHVLALFPLGQTSFTVDGLYLKSNSLSQQRENHTMLNYWCSF